LAADLEGHAEREEHDVLIVDPTQGNHERGQGSAAAPGAAELLGRVCLFSNSKPNALALLTGVARQIDGLEDAPMFGKPSAATPASVALLDRIARDHDGVLVAIGD
jgi:hypothetical protein